MSLLILIGIALVFFLVMNFTESKKETTKERIGDAISKTALDTASSIASVSQRITEPEEKRKIRLAREVLANKNGQFARSRFRNSSDLDEMLVISDQFRETLSFLGLDEDDWKELAVNMFYQSKILDISFLNDNTHTKETDKKTRESIVENEIVFRNDRITWGETHDELINALNHFQISPEEWIEYGYVVLAMHHIGEDSIQKEFGIYL